MTFVERRDRDGAVGPGCGWAGSAVHPGAPGRYRGEVDGLGLPAWEELDEREIHLRPGSILERSGPTRAS